MTLAELALGERAVIEGYIGQADVQIRLRELGLVSGTPVSIKRSAPFGDPIEIEVRGYCLSIRRSDARGILISKSKS